ncbi:MAG: hypothetical protein CFE24_15605, partial [Flavobacterium sp. BFFFF2]
MEMENHSPSNSNTLKIGLVVLLGALGLLGYLYYGSQNENADLQKLLGGSVEELEKIKAQLEQDKKRLKADSNFSTKKYEGKIAEYEAFLLQKDEDILKLKEENGLLNSQNLTLQTEKEQVITQNKSLSYAKDSLNSKVSEVSSQNEDLRRKVNVGSALKAVSVQVVGLTSKGKEKEGELKNKRIDQLKVSYILPSNPLTERNNKEVYMRVLDPNGAVLNDMARGGVLNFANQEIGYSTKQSVPYTNDDQRVDMFYKKEA